MLYDGRATNVVRERPGCDVMGCKDDAAVDAATTGGSWGYFCTLHHSDLCARRLGMGAGQVLLCGDDYDAELREHYDLPDEEN